jgi:hypothetical protein
MIVCSKQNLRGITVTKNTNFNALIKALSHPKGGRV